MLMFYEQKEELELYLSIPAMITDNLDLEDLASPDPIKANAAIKQIKYGSVLNIPKLPKQEKV